jgi:hypothetical protein
VEAARENSRINLAADEDPEFGELEEYLVDVHDPSIMCTTKEMTKVLTDRVGRFFKDHGYEVDRELVLGEVGRLKGNGSVSRRKTRVDLVAHRANRSLAIEIDSSPKAWSLKKLRHLKDRGHDVLWIRWDPSEMPGCQDRFKDDVATIALRLPFIVAEIETITRPRTKPKAINARNLSRRQARGITNGTRKNSPGYRPSRDPKGGRKYLSPVRIHDLPCPKCGKQDCAGLWHQGDALPGDG